MTKQSPAKNFGENQRRNNGGVRYDDNARRVCAKFAQSNIFVRHRAGIRTVARGRIADLAEVTPLRYNLADDVLIQHRNHANRKVARDAAADLEKTDRALLAFN